MDTLDFNLLRALGHGEEPDAAEEAEADDRLAPLIAVVIVLVLFGFCLAVRALGRAVLGL